MRAHQWTPADLRGEREWHYALVGESLFWDWKQNGARLGELLAFSRARAVPTVQSQGGLAPLTELPRGEENGWAPRASMTSAG